MPLSQEAREKTGYVRYEHDVEGTCFYCGEPTKYNDYCPPRDVYNDPELKAMVTVPFVYVSACHACKTGVYIKRYLLVTPETRRAWLLKRKVKKGASKDTIAAQLRAAKLHPWQRQLENGTIIEMDDRFLPPETVEMRRQYLEATTAPTVSTVRGAKLTDAEIRRGELYDFLEETGEVRSAPPKVPTEQQAADEDDDFLGLKS